MSHFIETCSKCGTTISQCRCMACDKVKRLGLCNACREKAVEVIDTLIKSTLTERRAEFVYNAARLAAQAAAAPIIPVLWVEREEAFKTQFLEVIERQCGEMRSNSPEELHGSWMQSYITMGWKYGEVYSREDKIHPDLVPYDQLGKLEQDKDAVFVALCEIARLWVYDIEVASEK